MVGKHSHDDGYGRLLAALPPAAVLGVAGVTVAGGAVALLAFGSFLTWLFAVPALPAGTAMIILAFSKTRGSTRRAQARQLAFDEGDAALAERVRSRLIERGAPATVIELATELALDRDDVIVALSVLQGQDLIREEISPADGSFLYQVRSDAAEPDPESHLSLRSRAESIRAKRRAKA